MSFSLIESDQSFFSLSNMSLLSAIDINFNSNHLKIISKIDATNSLIYYLGNWEKYETNSIISINRSIHKHVEKINKLQNKTGMLIALEKTKKKKFEKHGLAFNLYKKNIIDHNKKKLEQEKAVTETISLWKKRWAAAMLPPCHYKT